MGVSEAYVLCRGQNVNSIFGPSNSALTTAYSPVLVNSGPWSQITVAHNHVCGIVKNASAYCWYARVKRGGWLGCLGLLTLSKPKQPNRHTCGSLAPALDSL